MKSFSYSLLALLTCIASAQADARLNPAVHFRCYAPATPQYYVIFALDSKGVMRDINHHQYVQSDNQEESPFSVLSEEISQSSFENVRRFLAPNGYSIVTFISTADAISIGISKDRKQGFYRYQDLGSGNGNSQAKLVCTRVR